MNLKNNFKIGEIKTKQPSIKVFIIYFLFGFLCTTFIKDRMLATLFLEYLWYSLFTKICSI